MKQRSENRQQKNVLQSKIVPIQHHVCSMPTTLFHHSTAAALPSALQGAKRNYLVPMAIEKIM